MIGLADIDGVIRGKYVDKSKLDKVLSDTGSFCDCVFGWDIDDQLYDSSQYTGWHTGFPDCQFRLLPESKRNNPDDGTDYYIGEFTAEGSEFHPVCPRSCLRRVIQRVSEMGLSVKSGFEYEFFVFQESAHSVREKNYRGLVPFTPGNFGYSALRAATYSNFFKDLLEYCKGWGMPLEGLHCETGPGVWEAALSATQGMESADRACLFKTFSKVFFQRRDLIATFMAKWSMNYPGQSGHFHFSLMDAQGMNLLSGSNTVADAARHALGGLAAFLPDWLPMLAPTINSYTRLVKGAWAPTAASWGIENRTCAFRFIPGSEHVQRIENRVSGADANPYLVAAATLAAAMLGIERQMEPPAPISGNAYDVQEQFESRYLFSPTLRDATQRFKNSETAREIFGSDFVDHFAMTREWESREAERHVDSWQLERYFESS